MYSSGVSRGSNTENYREEQAEQNKTIQQSDIINSRNLEYCDDNNIQQQQQLQAEIPPLLLLLLLLCTVCIGQFAKRAHHSIVAWTVE